MTEIADVKWHGQRRNTTYRFYGVNWDSKAIEVEYETVTGGTLEWSAFTDTKADGKLDYVGEPPVSPDDEQARMLQVAMSFEDEHGEVWEQTLGTYIVTRPQPTLKPGRKEGSVDMSSPLVVLLSRRSPWPYTIKAGTNAIAKAAELVTACGLTLGADYTDAYTTKTAHTFKVEDSYLKIVNWLLSCAGYSSADIDTQGNIVFPKPNTSEQAVWTFTNDDTSTIYPEVKDEDNISERANVYQMTYTKDTECLWAQALNSSPVDPSSTVNLRYRVTEQENVTELDGGTWSARLANLKNMVKAKMLDNLSLIYYRTIKSAWIPLSTGDPISTVIDGEEWGGNVTNLQLSLAPEQETTIKARRFVTVPDDHISITGNRLRG